MKYDELRNISDSGNLIARFRQVRSSLGHEDRVHGSMIVEQAQKWCGGQIRADQFLRLEAIVDRGMVNEKALSYGDAT